MSVHAILWDLDDTLINTLPARMASLNHAHEKLLGSSVDPLALWRSHRGGTLEALGQRLLGDEGARFVSAYRDHYYGQPRTVPPFDGVEEVLGTFRDHGIPMAVVTSKISWGAVEELQQTGLLSYFAAVIGADDTEQNKPDPEPIFAALDRIFALASEDVLFVGDSPADMFAARNAGCTPVAATWGTLDEGLLMDAVPQEVVRAPLELIELVNRRQAA